MIFKDGRFEAVGEEVDSRCENGEDGTKVTVPAVYQFGRVQARALPL